jgi:hypothetical protein
MRDQAESRVVLLKVPEASVMTKTSKPSSMADSAGKGHAHFGDHAGDDQLLLAGGLDRGQELLVVPGVDVAGTGDVGRIRKHSP